MKYYAITILALVSLGGCNHLQQADTKDHRYLIKSAIVEYEMTGKKKGKETLYFDQYGLREARESEWSMSVMGFSQDGREKSLLLGTDQYLIDLDQRTGSKMENPFLKAHQEQEDKSMIEVGEEMMIQMGGEKKGQEKVLGKTCDIWEMPMAGTKTWIWKGIALKTETNMMGMNISINATSIKPGASIPDSMFEVPEDIDFSGSNGQDPMKGVEDMLKRLKKDS